VVAFGLKIEERKIVNLVMERGKINVSDALRIMKTTRWHTAQATMLDLVERGILDRHGEGKPRNSHQFFTLAKRSTNDAE